MTERTPDSSTVDDVPTARRAAPVFAWALAAVPLIGALELALHLRQLSSVVPPADWDAAAAAVKADVKPDDLVVTAPFWAAPLGREHARDVMTVARAAYPDVTRFHRAFELSIRGAHTGDLAEWKVARSASFGGVTLTVYENPNPATLHTDLLDRVDPAHLEVSQVGKDGRETACAFQRGATQGGTTVVPQGPVIPAARFACAGGYVAVGVLHDLEHRPRRCVFATSPGGAGTLRLRFKDVQFGAALHGHDGVQWVSERMGDGSLLSDTITVSFSARDRPLGTKAHRLGAGFTGFEFPTPELAGQTADLVVEVGGAPQRHFCFEADTRD